ncbi:hypothetical protein BGZ76_004850 [Entomortierella beljakovae]|nr:hypothetical protein BGZ76_004850 [Entomortierella beljakovae]
MTEQVPSTLSVDSQLNNDSSNALIQEIAFTNQISVQWDELRVVLKQRLDQVLKSGSLVYTAPSVTNPLTIKLAPKSSADTGQVDVQTPLTPTVATPIPTPIPSTPASQASSEQESSNNNQDQPQVPDQSLIESTLEESHEQHKDEDKKKSETESRTDETNIDDGKTTKEDTQNVENVENVESQPKDQNITSESNLEPLKESELTVQANVDEDILNNGSPMVPVSKDTLLVETPEGYHTRINALLDAFPSAPFTIQRICELLSNPTEHHTNVIKYLRAVEKVLMITSSVSEFSNPAYNGVSALDEDNNNAQSSAKTTANGDYSRSTNLNFMSIAEEATSEGSNDQEVQTGAVQNGSTEQTEEFATTSQNNTGVSLTAAQSEDGADEASGMEVESTTTDMDLDLSSGLNSMDGVEDGKDIQSSNNNENDVKNGSSNIQVDSEVDGGMELDQA